MNHDLPQGLIPQRFQAQRSLGQGSFGKTYLALDQESGMPCVIKELSLFQADSWKSVELFEREARVLAQLDHPRIPRFLGFYSQENGQQACLIQGYIPGQTLQAAIESGKRFSEAEILPLIEDLLDVLIYLQSFSPPVIHRDIKPGNIILSPEGKAFLVDFGAVNDNLLHHETGGSTVVGTFGYMPPEQLDGRAVPASDLYALGATLIFALSGLEPGQIEKENLSLNFRPYVQISDGLAAWLKKMTHPDFKHRFQNAQEALDALHLRNSPQNMFQTGLGSSKRSLLKVALVSALAVGGIFAGFQFLRPAASSVVQGQIHDIRPAVKNLPAIAPRFWIRDNRTGQRIKAPVNYDQGRFQIQGLPPGSYGLNVTFDTNSQNPLQYPGDLRAWNEFEVKAGQAPPVLDMALIQLLHLTSPVDNQSLLADWNQQCNGGATLSQVPEFSWEALGAGVSYDYQITEESCESGTAAAKATVIFSGSTTETAVQLKLKPNTPNHYYKLRLEARQGGLKIARLRTHGALDHDWDYNFRL